MALPNTISLETRFQLNNTPKNFKITDDTDYTAEGIALADVIGALVITNPLGSVIHSTVLPAFDIDVDVQDYIDTILLPLDSNLAVMEGTYTITYTIDVTGAVQAGEYSKIFTYDYCPEVISPDVDLTVDLICSNLTSTDNTAYPVTVTSSTLTHTIFPPSGLDSATYPPQIVSTNVNIYTPITTKTWTGKISNILEITYADGLIEDVTITGNSEKDIQDDINICNLQCNLRALGDRYSSALTNNPIDADRIAREQVTPALYNSFMYTSNIECGNFDKAETYYQEVLKFTGSQPDCECADSDTPTLITATCSGGSGGSTVVAVCGDNNALTVSANTVGDTTTYTMCFNDTLFDKITALKQVTVTSADGTITVTPSTSGAYDKNYDLSVTGANAGVHSFSGILDVTASQGQVPTFTWRPNFSTIVGNKLQEPTIVNTQPAYFDYSRLSNLFYLENYVDQAGGEFPKVIFQNVEVLYRTNASGLDYNGSLLKTIPLSLDTANDRIYFSITSQLQVPHPGGVLSDNFPLISITVIINA